MYLICSQGLSSLAMACLTTAYTASPVHRFYQMWQQLDCNVEYATETNPVGCKADLFPFVEVTIGAGSNGSPVPSPFTEETTGEGSAAMGFYNVQKGDAPYMLQLAQQYTLDDNFHQSIMGGTGANHIALGFGDAIYFSDSNGNPATASGKRNGLEGHARCWRCKRNRRSGPGSQFK